MGPSLLRPVLTLRQLCGVSVALSIASIFYQLSIPLKASIKGSSIETDRWYSPVITAKNKKGGGDGEMPLVAYYN